MFASAITIDTLDDYIKSRKNDKKECNTIYGQLCNNLRFIHEEKNTLNLKYVIYFQLYDVLR